MASERADVTQSTCIQDDSGKIVTGQQERDAWRLYMEKLMNEENDWDGEVISTPVEGPRCHLSNSQFEKSLKKCKSGKAAGPSGATTEMIAASGETGIEWMADLCNCILDEGQIPEDWTQSIMVPL